MTKTRNTAKTITSTPEPGDEIDRLGTMKIGELQALYAEVLGETTRCPNRTYLIKRIMSATVASPTEASDEVAIAPVSQDSAPSDASDAVNEGAIATTSQEPAASATTNVPDAPEPVPPAPDLHVESVQEAANQASDPALSSLEISELQARYAAVLGRTTTSTNRGYLLWKIRQGQAGKVPVGPRQRHQKTGDAVMVLPLRMEADLVDKLDEAWRRQGLRSRMELFRRSLQAYLASVGENDVAALLAGEA